MDVNWMLPFLVRESPRVERGNCQYLQIVRVLREERTQFPKVSRRKTVGLESDEL